MNINSLPLVAAIPNHNMADELGDLLPSLLEQGYDGIFVLDDKSTDDSRKVVEETDGVTFIGGEDNVGAGPNRNRIIGNLSTRSIIHFMDADTVPETPNMPKVIRDALPKEAFAFMGGLVLTPEGEQDIFNYGNQQGLKNMVSIWVHLHIDGIAKTDPSRAELMREKYSKLLEGRPNPYMEPERREVFWARENNLVIQSDLFEKMGGFAPGIREHEIQDLAIRLAKVGLSGLFDPSFAVVHHNKNVRTEGRQHQKNIAQLQIAKRHGFKEWVLN